MNCAACGAPLGKGRSHCAICGAAREQADARPWDKQVEAATFEGLQTTLANGETLLGASRGKLVGNWRPRLSIDPRAWISPYANVGLTNERLLLQAVDQTTGAAVSGAAGVKLADIRSVTIADADAMEPGRTVRLSVILASGESFRMKVTGRLADGARELAEVWQSLYGTSNASSSGLICTACGRGLDRVYKFCPYCGKEQESE